MARPLTEGLSKRQRDVLKTIQGFLAKTGVPPTVREIGGKLGIESSTVFQHLNYLEAKGYVRRADRGSRTIELVGREMPKTARCDIVPLVGMIAAGKPVTAGEDSAEDLVVASLKGGAADKFALEVTGESMIEAGILDGDIVIVRKQNTANDGDIVVALVDGEVTLKYFHKEGRKVRLQPGNKQMKPIYVTKGEFEIQGKVVAVQKRV